MIEGTSRGLLGLFLWSFVPGFFSNILLTQYHKYRYPDASSRPKKGTARYRKQYIYAYTTVMMSYFAYCIGQTVNDLPPSYYTKMGVDRTRVDTDLKPRFKALVMQLHPDKNPEADPQQFLEVKHNYEALENSELRTLYEVFGEHALKNASVSSKRAKNARITFKDVFDSSIVDLSIYFIGSAIVLLILAMISNSSGIYWRITGLLLCASTELYVMTRPAQVLAFDKTFKLCGLEKFWGRFTIHEKIVIFKSFVVNLAIVVTQLISLNEAPERPVAEEILELSKNIQKITSAPLKDLADDQAAEILEMIAKDESFAKVFRNRIGRYMSELEKASA